MATQAPPLRRPYIDWMRGVAVLIMILGHSTDAWTIPGDRDTRGYELVVKIAGIGAPLFLFLAGLAVPLSCGTKLRRGSSVPAAAAAVRRRGWEIFGLAFLFRLQSWAIGLFRAPVAGMLKVDILNVMGPSIAAAATLWGLGARPAVRFATFAAAATFMTLATPLVRAAAWPAVLPDPLEWYLRPPPNRSWFTLFPWAGLLFAGAAAGVLVDGARDRQSERRLNAWFLVTGAAMFLVALGGSHLPSVYRNSSFWTTAPSYFLLRVGLMVFGLGASYVWLQRPTAHRWSPLLVFGNSSLFVYWIHVELAYGAFSRSLHRALPLGPSLVAFLLLTAFMFVLTLVKLRVVAVVKSARQRRLARGGPVAAAGTNR